MGILQGHTAWHPPATASDGSRLRVAGCLITHLGTTWPQKLVIGGTAFGLYDGSEINALPKPGPSVVSPTAAGTLTKAPGPSRVPRPRVLQRTDITVGDRSSGWHSCFGSREAVDRTFGLSYCCMLAVGSLSHRGVSCPDALCVYMSAHKWVHGCRWMVLIESVGRGWVSTGGPVELIVGVTPTGRLVDGISPADC